MFEKLFKRKKSSNSEEFQQKSIEENTTNSNQTEELIKRIHERKIKDFEEVRNYYDEFRSLVKEDIVIPVYSSENNDSVVGIVNLENIEPLIELVYLNCEAANKNCYYNEELRYEREISAHSIRLYCTNKGRILKSSFDGDKFFHIDSLTEIQKYVENIVRLNKFAGNFLGTDIPIGGYVKEDLFKSLLGDKEYKGPLMVKVLSCRLGKDCRKLYGREKDL